MNPEKYINDALKRGNYLPLDHLGPKEKIIFLISEAELCCDMDGIDSLFEKYNESFYEDFRKSFSSIGASQIGQLFDDLKSANHEARETILEELNNLITSRHGYSHESIVEFLLKKQTLLMTFGVIVEVTENELDQDFFNTCPQIDQKLTSLINEALPGHPGWISGSFRLLENPEYNAGRCTICHAWVSDIEKPRRIPELGIGACFDGQLYCDEHLPEKHPHHF